MGMQWLDVAGGQIGSNEGRNEMVETVERVQRCVFAGCFGCAGEWD